MKNKCKLQQQKQQQVLDYCKQHGPMLDQMTTTAITRHLKSQFPEIANINPIIIVDALSEWCKKHRPKIAG